MKLINIADEGAGYKAQLYELYDNAFPEQEKKPLHVMEQLVNDGKMEMLAISRHRMRKRKMQRIVDGEKLFT